MMIEPCLTIDCRGWLQLRLALWSHDDADEHFAEMARFVAEPERFVQFIAYNNAGGPVGLVEAALRADYVNGTESSPVMFLEGVYVVPSERRKGIARLLVEAVEEWARDRGCVEFASDALSENHESHRFHQAIGFKETERVVFFRRAISPPTAGE